MNVGIMKFKYSLEQYQADGDEYELPCTAMIDILHELDLKYIVQVIYFDYKNYKECVENIMDMDTQATFGLSINLDSLLLLPSTKTGLCALLLTNATKNANLNEAASAVEMEKITYSEYRILSNIQLFLSAKKEFPFVGDQLFLQKNFYATLEIKGVNSIAANVRKIPIRTYLSCDDQVSKIAISLNVFSTKCFCFFFCCMYVYVVNNKHLYMRL